MPLATTNKRNENVSAQDGSNVYMLPSKKVKTKKKAGGEVDARGRKKQEPKKALSKKQFKKLTAITERRKKRLNREHLLEGLKKHEISADELKQFSAVATLGTKPKISHDVGSSTSKVSSIKGSNKKRRIQENLIRPARTSDSSSSDSEEEDNLRPEQSNESEGHAAQIDTGVTTEAAGSVVNAGDAESHPDGNVQSKAPVENGPPSAEGQKATTTITPRGSAGDSRTVNVPVFRRKEVEEERNKLPILGMEQEIVEAVKDNDVTVICGETGSGKTTQVPQFLYEAGFSIRNSPPSTSQTHPSKRRHHGNSIEKPSKTLNKDNKPEQRMIGITEPRRVAAISMAARVGLEMGLSASQVSYQIRYEGTTTDDSIIKFMTDGVLLKEVQSDFLLTRYSVLIIDEAHERSMYSDILIGLLSRIVPLRAKRNDPLKLIVMSATLRIEDFTGAHLFRTPPAIVRVDSRQFPVTIYFNRVTPTEDYLSETFRKVSKIHRLLPDGVILVFVPGQREIHTLIARLKKAFPIAEQNPSLTSSSQNSKKSGKAKTKGATTSPNPMDTTSSTPDSTADTSLLDYNDADIVDAEFDDTVDEINNDEEKEAGSVQPLYCLPLYSLLPTSKQARVFQPPPPAFEGCRVCVVATNVAETSLTIPGVRYVVDTGKAKQRVFSASSGVSRFEVGWVSQASANQRAGRAGRVGPGHCYRLYSSAVFTDFSKFPPPDIATRPFDELVLQMKSMAILKVVNFPFPTPPDPESLSSAEQRLIRLGVLEAVDSQPNRGKQNQESDKVAKITPLGKELAKYPIQPAFAKILLVAKSLDVLPHAVALVSALSVRELLLNIGAMASSEKLADDKTKKDTDSKFIKWARLRHLWAKDPQITLHPFADFSVLLSAIGAADHYCATYSPRNQRSMESVLTQFCSEHGLRHKALVEVRKLRYQLSNILQTVSHNPTLSLASEDRQGDDDDSDSEDGRHVLSVEQLTSKLNPPTSKQRTCIQQAVLAGLSENVARHAGTAPDGSILKGAYYCANGMKDPVFIHPSSVIKKTFPEYVVYTEIVESFDGEKKYIQGVMGINPDWLPLYCRRNCSFGEPDTSSQDESSLPYYDPTADAIVASVPVTFGVPAWPLPSPALVPLPSNSMDTYRRFACALLEGKVVSGFAQFRPSLLASPNTMLKSWAKLQPRTQALLDALVEKQVLSRRKLAGIWETEDEIYLWKEFTQWIPESLHAEAQLDWPPL